MPTTIILGKEGTQPFRITNNCVSSKHAKITISDKGKWYLEDLGSTNGTFFRKETDSQLIRIGNGQFEITPMTFICLGPDNIQGCRFYARQALKENHGDYSEEYRLLGDIYDRYTNQLQKIETNTKLIRWAGQGINAILLAVSFCISDNPNSQKSMYLILRCGIAATTFATMLYDGAASKKKLEEKRKRLCKCPNPACNHILTPDEINDMRCQICKQSGIGNNQMIKQ